METDKIILGNNVDILGKFPDNVIDLTVTSPPYDDMRKYGGDSGFDFDKLAGELYRVTKDGGVVVWVVADQSYHNTESGTSFRQALGFKEHGFKLYDTMIYKKNVSMVMHKCRYIQIFEYMFILAKLEEVKHINAFNPIMVKNKYAGEKRVSINQKAGSNKEILGAMSRVKPVLTINETKIKSNIWEYEVGKYHNTKDLIAHKHPAIFPDQLAADHISSWSNQGDIILDPFCGSGTTCAVAKKMNRKYIGIEINKEYYYIALSRCS